MLGDLEVRIVMKSSSSHANEDKSLFSIIAEILEEILGVKNLGTNDNIVSLGLSSIQVARFLGLIKQKLGNPLSIKDIYVNQKIGTLAEHLSQDKAINYGPSEILQLEADSHFADDIELIPSWSSEGRVFLTGATGFVGANLLYRLLSKPSMKEIACLARGNKHHSPMDRIQDALKKYDLWNGDIAQNIRKIIVLDGDMTQVRLGLSQSQYQWLTNWSPAVFHAAAKVNWYGKIMQTPQPGWLLTQGNPVLRVAGKIASHGWS
ncbi:uncharacterized protein N7477_001693 [Penicillium maclennaniae]|uniref:uncharacterized protein n=1 Tax=Penicillium maclennaniae TaxID=1343394 RepID=UPI002542606D|nr:uncharacterized protein N7477_001693 [Penicillium maclennaniae]KAJ5681753.1 hypothetical protein N7477_001693 [Penicillium maclennaniae]